MSDSWWSRAAGVFDGDGPVPEGKIKRCVVCQMPAVDEPPKFCEQHWDYDPADHALSAAESRYADRGFDA